jgi:ATP-dependent DNA helicase RecQ
MKYDGTRALQLLREGSADESARFRPGQEDAISHVVNGQGRLLVVQKTGWGKSFVYFIATKLLREAGAGPALLVSPLLALMRNQIAAAQRMGVRAVTINSDNQDDWAAVERQVANDEVDILLISPERLANERFREEVLSSVGARISLLVVDEAHCISDWGHDFRPHYRLVERIARTLPANLRLLATTATANSRVLDDLDQVLGPNLDVSVGELSRESLTLQTIRMPHQTDRLAWLADRLGQLDGHGIIYTLTVRDAYQVADWLKSRGFAVEAYTGDSGDLRESLEEALLTNQVKALVATTALGMGYDKPDLAFVIHYQTPGSVVAYYQQVGRAGRALDAAYGVLLSGPEENDINKWFITSAFPTVEEVAEIINALEDEADGLSLYELLAKVNISMGRVQKTLQLLSLESPAPIVKQDSKWQLTVSKLSSEFWERAERLTGLRREEQQQMQDYVDLPFGQHMAFLVDALDGDTGHVSQPKLPELVTTAQVGTIMAAEEFLDRTNVPIKPRKRWPIGGWGDSVLKGGIAEQHQAEEGRALCHWGDSGWGSLVQDGKYGLDKFSDDLVSACVRMIREWKPNPAPTWVTAVPSLNRPLLVPDFAQRVALELGLPFRPVLAQTRQRPEQKTMENGFFQAANLYGTVAINSESVPGGPVLLVDDLVDSGWTMSVTAWLLRSSGSGPVWPVALASAGPG